MCTYVCAHRHTHTTHKRTRTHTHTHTCTYACTHTHTPLLALRVFADQLKEYSAKCDSLLSEIGAALSCLQEVKQKHAFVASKTGALHQACQNLMDEQTKLMVVADSIRTKLAYFNEFDRMGQVN